MDRSIDQLSREFTRIGDGFDELYGRLGEAAMLRRPAANSWSAAECVRHLEVTSDSYFPIWEPCIERARREDMQSRSDLHMDLVGRLLVRLMEPPPKARVSAPAALLPSIQQNANDVMLAFRESQRKLIRTLKDADGLAIDKIKIASPFASWVRYSVWSSFCVAAVHQRRHLWQAEEAAKLL